MAPHTRGKTGKKAFNYSTSGETSSAAPSGSKSLTSGGESNELTRPSIILAEHAGGRGRRAALVTYGGTLSSRDINGPRGEHICVPSAPPFSPSPRDFTAISHSGETYRLVACLFPPARDGCDCGGGRQSPPRARAADVINFFGRTSVPRRMAALRLERASSSTPAIMFLGRIDALNEAISPLACYSARGGRGEGRGVSLRRRRGGKRRGGSFGNAAGPFVPAPRA